MISAVQSAADLLRGVIIMLEPRMRPEDVENAWDLIDYDEWGIAYELICTQLQEYGIVIDKNEFALLQDLGEFGKFEPSTWEDLRPER